MQHKQVYFKRLILAAYLSVAGILAGNPAYSAGAAQHGQPDPILSGGPAGPCDAQTASADLVGGTDVNGRPVVPADLDRGPVPVPAHIDLPVRTARGTAYVTADGKSLVPLLNPPPGCAAPSH